jgi:hypothetical protein
MLDIRKWVLIVLAAWIFIGRHEITSYNAVPSQTDKDSDIGAGGRVAVKGKPLGNYFACNWLAFGVKIKIPSLTGDKVWICKDRTHKKVGHRIDLLLPIGQNIGKKVAEVYLWRD